MTQKSQKSQNLEKDATIKVDKADGNTEIIGRTKALRSRAWFFLSIIL